VVGADQIVSLAAREEEANRVAQSIGEGVNLGAQSAPRAPDGLVLNDFFWAPAPC
jgi:hypothetical protein